MHLFVLTSLDYRLEPTQQVENMIIDQRFSLKLCAVLHLTVHRRTCVRELVPADLTDTRAHTFHQGKSASLLAEPEPFPAISPYLSSIVAALCVWLFMACCLKIKKKKHTPLHPLLLCQR